MKIGIISDTHDNVPAIVTAVNIFKEHGCMHVFHCGDVVAPITVTYFNGLPVIFVKGNCDGDSILLMKKTEEIGGVYAGLVFETVISGKKIAMIHGNDRSFVNKYIGKVDYLFRGHTHQKDDTFVDNTRVINPGSLYLGNDNWSLAVLDLAADHLRFIDL